MCILGTVGDILYTDFTQTKPNLPDLHCAPLVDEFHLFSCQGGVYEAGEDPRTQGLQLRLRFHLQQAQLPNM